MAFFISLFLISAPVYSQENPTANAAAPSTANLLPDTGEIIDKIETFSTQKAEFETSLQDLGQAKFDESVFTSLQERFDSLQTFFIKRRLLSSWDLYRATDFKNAHKGLFGDAVSVKSRYVNFIKKFDETARLLQNKKSEFRKYLLKSAKDQALAGQLELITGILKDIENSSAELKKLREELIKKFDPHSDLLDKITKFQSQLQSEIDYFKKERFHKTESAFYESSFWAQFAPSLANETLLNIRLSFQTDRYALEIIICWLVLMGLLGSILTRIPVSPPQKNDVRLLLLTYTVFAVLDVVGLPVPIYRIMLAGVSGLAFLYCLFRQEKPFSDTLLYRFILKTMMMFFLAAVTAEFLGYHLLGVLLTNGTIKSVFVVMAAWNLRYLFLKIVNRLF